MGLDCWPEILSMTRITSILNKVVKAVSTHFPHIIPIAGIFIAVFLVTAATNHYQLREHVIAEGKKSIAKLEQYIDSVADGLQLLHDSVGKSCTFEDRLKLKEHVFNSHMIKEIGLYKNGTVYCTNEGPANIHLFNSTLQRIAASPKHITVSLSHSQSRLSTFFIYASDGEESGINALLHPNQFLELISPAFDRRNYGYQIQVLHKVIQSHQEQQLRNNHLFEFSSDLYPFSLTIFLTPATYKTHYLSHLGETILLALVLSLIYFIVRYQALAKLSVEYSLLHAIKQEQLELYLQPIVDIHSRTLVGSEALIRWNHPAQGQISPEQFIPLAEKLGAIDQITKYAFKEVTRFLKQNPDYVSQSYISINISRYQILKPEFVSFINSYAKRYPQYTRRIVLELTENVDLTPEQLDIAIGNLKHFQQLGFEIAIDDFGTGYSGLNLVRQMKFDVVKIDQVFTKSLHTDSNIKPVLKSMIQLAADLGMKVIAEGVENESQIEQLEQLGVKYIQGFYYAKPIKPDDLARFHQMTNEAIVLSDPIPRWKS